MNKKAFTLVELLSVIVILTLIVVLVFEEFSRQVRTAKQQSYERQVTTIISIAKDYHLKNIDKTGVTLKTLDNSGLLTTNDMKDPRNNNLMDGCVLFEKDSYGQIKYNYIENFDKCFDENMNKLYILKNLVTNGGFENESVGWELSSEVSISSSKSKYGDNSIRNSGSEQNGAAYISNEYYTDVMIGHKYYVSSWLYIESNGNGSCYTEISIRDADVDYWETIDNATVLNNWQQISNIYSIANSISPQLVLALAKTSATDRQQDCYADAVMIIDLTETFGIGKEPTKEWCDAHIPYIE